MAPRTRILIDRSPCNIIVEATLCKARAIGLRVAHGITSRRVALRLYWSYVVVLVYDSYTAQWASTPQH